MMLYDILARVLLAADPLALPSGDKAPKVDIPDVKEQLQALSTVSVDELIDKTIRGLIHFAVNVGIAILVFYVGKFVINRLYYFVFHILERRKVDTSLSTFLLSLIKLILYFILIITVIGILGLETSSFLAIFASAGVAVGLALSGTLQNFAGGVLILLLKPYRVGDYIEAQGYAGTVMEIQIFSTVINTFDNKSIIIPNGPLSTSSVNNWSREDYRRIDWPVSISYGDNIDDARRGLLKILDSDPRIVKTTLEADREMRKAEAAQSEVCPADELKEPDGECEAETTDKRPAWWRRMIRHIHFHRALYRRHVEQVRERLENPPRIAQPAKERPPVVVVNQLADSSVNLIARAWTRTSDYWSVLYDINERIYTELPDLAGVSFPFPQLDVHQAKS